MLKIRAYHIPGRGKQTCTDEVAYRQYTTLLFPLILHKRSNQMNNFSEREKKTFLFSPFPRGEHSGRNQPAGPAAIVHTKKEGWIRERKCEQSTVYSQCR